MKVHRAVGVSDERRQRVEQAIGSASTSLDLLWLPVLDGATADRIATWGSGDSGKRSLFLTGLHTIEPDTAASLANWGNADSGPRELQLDGLHTIEPAAASRLADWASQKNNRLFCELLEATNGPQQLSET